MQKERDCWKIENITVEKSNRREGSKAHSSEAVQALIMRGALGLVSGTREQKQADSPKRRRIR